MAHILDWFLHWSAKSCVKYAQQGFWCPDYCSVLVSIYQINLFAQVEGKFEISTVICRIHYAEIILVATLLLWKLMNQYPGCTSNKRMLQGTNNKKHMGNKQCKLYEL